MTLQFLDPPLLDLNLFLYLAWGYTILGPFSVKPALKVKNTSTKLLNEPNGSGTVGAEEQYVHLPSTRNLY